MSDKPSEFLERLIIKKAIALSILDYLPFEVALERVGMQEMGSFWDYELSEYVKGLCLNISEIRFSDV